MLSYTIEIKDRSADKPRISREEAAAMAAAGFTFRSSTTAPRSTG
jgi:hypothetical protein